LQGGRIVSIPKGRELSFNERLKSNILLRGLDDKMMAVSANIRCGASGGPVILEDGSVAGMNQSFIFVQRDRDRQTNNDKKAFKQALVQSVLDSRNNINLAVPLPKILDFVRLHGIVPDAGPTTVDWRAALTDYRNGDFAAAKTKLDKIAPRQWYSPNAGLPYRASPSAPLRIASHYVEELRDLVNQSVGK
ncbi:MAG: hypothetical protein ABL921_24445, partial [Pirellula sp.]